MALSRVADVSSHAASCGGMGVVPRLHHPGVRLRIAVPCAAAAAAGVQEQYTTFEVVPEEAIKVRGAAPGSQRAGRLRA
jgi:hypothetical protein